MITRIEKNSDEKYGTVTEIETSPIPSYSGLHAKEKLESQIWDGQSKISKIEISSLTWIEEFTTHYADGSFKNQGSVGGDIVDLVNGQEVLFEADEYLIKVQTF